MCCNISLSIPTPPQPPGANQGPGGRHLTSLHSIFLIIYVDPFSFSPAFSRKLVELEGQQILMCIFTYFNNNSVDTRVGHAPLFSDAHQSAYPHIPHICGNSHIYAGWRNCMAINHWPTLIKTIIMIIIKMMMVITIEVDKLIEGVGAAFCLLLHTRRRVADHHNHYHQHNHHHHHLPGDAHHYLQHDHHGCDDARAGIRAFPPE